ncbi:hypothetical protein [Rhizobium laguerreae]|uniref:hypothetical protein n=1 Tax=Rhizobium laguerreae TaxID=1076926 RepID=UPI00144168DB|nr:hypothetical protein [Rhizobium laguerreae]
MIVFRVPAGSGGAAEAAHGVLFAPVPVGLERRLDLDEERNLDGQFQAEFPLAEEVSRSPCRDCEPTAGGGEELSELLHGIFSFRNAYIAGIGRMADNEGRT